MIFSNQTLSLLSLQFSDEIHESVHHEALGSTGPDHRLTDHPTHHPPPHPLQQVWLPCCPLNTLSCHGAVAFAGASVGKIHLPVGGRADSPLSLRFSSNIISARGFPTCLSYTHPLIHLQYQLFSTQMPCYIFFISPTAFLNNKYFCLSPIRCKPMP